MAALTNSNTLNNNITTSGNIFLNNTYKSIAGTSVGSLSTNTNSYNPLEKLDYKIDFNFIGNDFTKNQLLDNIKSIKKNKMLFHCNVVNNRMQPYDLIMKMIEKKEQFSVKIQVSDILTINYVNFRFTEIHNNLNFRFTEIHNNLNFNETDKCDFSVLKVKFEFDKILTENKKLSTKQLRTDKMKKIISNEEL